MPKVNFFVWLALKNKLLTGDNLAKCGFNGPLCCCLCNSTFETVDHLLVDCVFSRKVWELILQDLNCSITIQSSVLALYLGWHASRPLKASSSLLHLHCHSILNFYWWALWLIRNNCIFNETTPSI